MDSEDVEDKRDRSHVIIAWIKYQWHILHAGCCLSGDPSLDQISFFILSMLFCCLPSLPCPCGFRVVCVEARTARYCSLKIVVSEDPSKILICV